mmetsp:Transcript_14037/g.33638  ORF Transcript_14037/g.33638 Transcript_14037/m.33638 type:complete len:132 (+) Transcript_14037:265-660(+)
MASSATAEAEAVAAEEGFGGVGGEEGRGGVRVTGFHAGGVMPAVVPGVVPRVHLSRGGAGEAMLLTRRPLLRPQGCDRGPFRGGMLGVGGMLGGCRLRLGDGGRLGAGARLGDSGMLGDGGMLGDRGSLGG